MANAFQIAEQVLGQAIDMDGVYGAQCLSGEYLVKLEDNTYKYVKDLQVGDKLSTGNTVIENYPKESPVAWLRSSQGWFKVTLDHKVFTNNGEKKVKDLTRKDSILLDTTYVKENNYELTPDEWKLFGLWLGDGSINYRWENSITPTIRITLGTQEKYDYIDNLEVTTRKNIHSNKKARIYSLVNKAHPNLWKLIKEFGDKSITDVFTKEQYRYIIEGYSKADGSIDGNSCVITSVNKQLLVTIQHGCHVNGWSAVLSKKINKKPNNFSNNPKPLWRLTVNKKRNLINNFISLEPCGEDTIYVLNTDGNHSYFADNQMHHNCADLAQYVAKAFGTTLGGNGNQIGTIGDISAYADVIPYTEGMELKTGDIISLAVGEYGHVVVYGGGNARDALVIDQNYAGDQHVRKHRYSLFDYGMTPLRIVRFRGQDNYVATDANGYTVANSNATGTNVKILVFYEITCDKVEGVDSPGGTKVLDTFYKCNKVTGEINGDYLIYDKYTGSVGYLPKSCVKVKEDYNKQKNTEQKTIAKVNGYTLFSDTTSDGVSQANTQIIYSLDQFIRQGRVNWGGFEWTYLSQDSLTGSNIVIPGKYVNAHGYVSDSDGYIVLSAPTKWGEVKGRIYNTPFGYKGKVYNTSSDGSSFGVYIR